MKLMKKTLVSAAILAGLASANAFAGTEACFEYSSSAADADLAKRWSTIYTGGDCAYDAAVTADKALFPSNPVLIAQEITKNNVITLNVPGFGIPGSGVVQVNASALRHVFFVPTTNIPGGSRFEVKLSANASDVSFDDNQLYFVLLKANKDTNGDIVSYTLTNVASTDGAVKGQTELTFVVDATTSISAGSRLLVTNKSINPQTFTVAAVVPNPGDSTTTPPTPPSTPEEIEAMALANQLAALGSAADFLTGFTKESGGLNIVLKDNDNCNEPTVSIAVTSAETDAGRSIEGGVTNGARLLIDSVEQFTGLHFGGPGYNLVGANGQPAMGVVDSLDPSRLTEFDMNVAGDYQNMHGVDEVHYNKYFRNRRTNLLAGEQPLDVFVNIQATDRLLLDPVASKDLKAARFLVRDRALQGSATDDLNYLDTAYCYTTTNRVSPSALGGCVGYISHLDLPATSVFSYYLSDFFYNAGGVKQHTFAVAEGENGTNPVTYDPARIMGYSYDVSLNWGIKFADAGLKDKNLTRSCAVTVPSHKITVNGTQLKVPYVFDTNNQWVRIANEHAETAEVYFDIFGEEGANAVQTENVFLGTIPANSAKVFFANDVIEIARAEGYDHTVAPGAASNRGQQADTRHTVTFLVTAPSDKVHGVSIQKIPGGVDRVIPVLRNHDETKPANRAAIWQQ